MVPACESAPTEAPAVQRDSAGIRLIEHRADMVAPATWSLEDPPEAVIGDRAETDAAHQFTEVRGAVRLSDGRVVVGDWDTREARYFDRTGDHVLTVGGPGGGPGEIRNLYNLDRVRGDTMVIDGWPIGTRYWYDENGDFLHGDVLGPWFPGMLGRTLPDGSLLLDTYELGSYGNTIERWAAYGTDEDIRPTGVIERVSRDGSQTDTIAPIRGEWHHKSGELRVNFASHALPWSPIGLVAWSADHIFVGHTERAEVRVYTLTGTLVRIIRWEASPLSVTSADRAAFTKELMDGLRGPQLEPFYGRWLREISWPAEKPAFSAMIADDDGYLWVRPSVRADEDEVEWLIYGPDGSIAAFVRLPTRFDLLDVDRTHAIARWKDELDVDHLAAYAIVR